MNADATTFLTLDQVAARLGVSRATIERWVHDRGLESFKKGGVRLVSEESLTRFVLLNTVKAKRPDWCTAAVETDFRNLLRRIVDEKIEMGIWRVEQRFKVLKAEILEANAAAQRAQRKAA